MSNKYKVKFAEPHEEIRVLSGQMRVLQSQNEYLYNVELDLLDDRLTLNNWRYENLETHRKDFAGIPLLIAYTRHGMKIGDGHNFKMKRTADGSQYASFVDADSERIVGTISSNDSDIKVVDMDGHKWIVGKGSIWSWYAREAVEKIAARGSMDVSIETLVVKNRMEGDVEVEEEYIPLGVTILGDGVPPAVRGANIRPLSAENLSELKLRAASYIETKQEDAPNEESKGVKTTMNKAKRMRELSAMFPQSHVLGMSEDGLSVVLCSDDGDVRGYTFDASEPNNVVDSRFCGANAVAHCVLANGVEVDVAFESALGHYVSRVNELCAELNETKEACKNAEEQMEEAKNALTARNRADAKCAVERELEDINDTSDEEERVDASTLNEINADIDNGVYDNEMNANGEWAGAEKACAVLNAKVMSERTKKRKEAKRNSKVSYGWSSDVLGSNSGMSDTDELLRSMGIH